MINKLIVSIWLVSQFLPCDTFAQCKTDLLNKILKNQKEYYNKIPTQNKKFYISLINLAKWIRPKVLSKIDSLDNNFKLTTNPNFNIVEGYDFAHGNVYGLIWVATNYYEYINNPAKIAGSDLSVKKVDFSQLTDEHKNIISNFHNWNSKIFQSINKSSRFANPPLYYLASKVYKNCKIQTIAFCY
jgi:hypothetical protein